MIRKEAVNRLPRPFLDDLNRGYASGGLVKAARWWIDKGARASEHPAFGGVSYGGHMPNSKHYSGNAVDLNYGVTGPGEMAFFDKFLPAFRSAFKNIGVIWRAPGHYNHMHIENGGVNNIGGGVGGAGLMDLLTKPLKLVKNMINKIPGSGGFTDMMKKMVRKLMSAAKDKLVEKIPFLGDLGEGIVGASSAIKGKVQNIASKFGWGQGKQWQALDWLVSKESSWNPRAANPTSSARGLFQQMTSVHGPVASSVAGQAKWGLDYILGRYGSPLKAVQHWKQHNWYANGGLVDAGVFDSGGVLPPGRSVVDNRTGRPEPLYTQDQLNSAGRGPTVGTMVVADPRAAVRELEAMERRAAVRANVRGIR